MFFSRLLSSGMMFLNATVQGVFEGAGGGFYNRVDIVVDGESDFSLNQSSARVGGGDINSGIDCVSCTGCTAYCSDQSARCWHKIDPESQQPQQQTPVCCPSGLQEPVQ